MTEHRTKSMKEGASAAKFLRKDQLKRRLNRARDQGDSYMALEALFDYVNDQEVKDAWLRGLSKEDDPAATN